MVDGEFNASLVDPYHRFNEARREAIAERMSQIRQMRLDVPLELLDEYYRTQNRNLRNEIIERMLPFSRNILATYVDDGGDFDDFEQIAFFAALKAVQRYIPGMYLEENVELPLNSSSRHFSDLAAGTIVGDLERNLRWWDAADREPELVVSKTSTFELELLTIDLLEDRKQFSVVIIQL